MNPVENTMNTVFNEYLSMNNLFYETRNEMGTVIYCLKEVCQRG